MATDPYAHQVSNWMKQRLDEMDATLTSIDTRVAALQADAKKQAEKAVADIRGQRAAFEEAIRTSNNMKARLLGQRLRLLWRRIGPPSKPLSKTI